MNNNYRGVRPSTAKKNTLPPETDNLEEYMKILYDHQKQCEKAGKYLEADCAKQRLKDLKIQFESKTKVDIKDRHEQEVKQTQQQKYDLTTSHQEEMQNFNAFWEGKIEEFEQEAQKLKNELQQKQEDELQQFLQELENSIPQMPKDSAELLSLKKTEEQLAKQEEYLEAHKTQQRIAQLQKEESDKWAYQRNTKIKNLIQQLKVKQMNETSALNQRIENASEEQKKIKKAEEEKMIQKYTNIKKELEGKQLQELQKVEKNFKNSSSMYSMSKMSKMGSSMQQEDCIYLIYIQNNNMKVKYDYYYKLLFIHKQILKIMDLFIQKICDKQFGKEVVQCIEINDQETMNQLIQAVSKIMKEKHPPRECLYGLKIIKDGIEKFNDKFKELVRTELMDQITEVALFRIKDHDDQRGVSYFKNPEHDRGIDSFGASYIRLAVDCVRVWARWFPDFQPFLEKVNKQNGYLPPINYFKPEIIELHAQKQSMVTPTPKDEAEQVQMKIEQLNQQLQTLLSAYTVDNGYVKDQLALINAQLEDIFIVNDQDQFVGDFVLAYPEYIEGQKPYSELREQFLKNLKQGSQFQQQQPSKIQQQQVVKQDQQVSQIFNNEANLQKSEFNNKIEVLQKEIYSKDQQIKKLSDEVTQTNQLLFERNNELQQANQQLTILQKENKDLAHKINQEQAYFQGQLLEQQQQIEFLQKEHQKLQEKIQVDNQVEPINYQDNQNSLLIQQLQEELENLKVEKNLLQEQNKQYQQRSTQLCNQQDYQNLKQRFDELDSKYYLLKQENFKLRQMNQELGNQSINQSRINENNNPESESRVINPNINFYNFKDSDLWSVKSVSLPASSIAQNDQYKDISQLIYPHKSAAEYYRATGKKQFKGTLIQKNQFPIELNQGNQVNFKKASLNQISSLYQTNKIEIKSRQQLLTAQNKQEFISTTLSIKNKDLAKVQLQIINNNNNVWINKDTKSTVLQSQQTISYEFIRESNVKLHYLTQITLSINFTPTTIYLPNFILNCIKFTTINAEIFKQTKKQFQGTIYKTGLQQIACQPEMLQLKRQGTLLNICQGENDDLITPNKFGYKAILCNQLEFYLELITTPCDEFLFRGFTSFDEESLQFILNILSNLYGV